jgi:hypothetical protein
VKGILKSNMVLVLIMFILLTAVALFSGNIVSTHAASAAFRVSQHSLQLKGEMKTTDKGKK